MTAIDIDKNAIDTLNKNLNAFDIEDVIVHQLDVFNIRNDSSLCSSFDTVIMNPPFGTKKMTHADTLFLEKAALLTKHAIYSMHKTSTRRFIEKKAKQLSLNFEVIAEMKFEVKNMYKFHKMKSKDINVDIIRCTKQ